MAKDEKKAPREALPEQNGVTRPKADSSTGKVWSICDKLSAKGNTASRAAVIEACSAAGINEATAATQYGRWRKFNGISGTVASAAPKKAAAPKAPAKVAPKDPAKTPAKAKAIPKPPAKAKASVPLPPSR